jgi:hypothetical protein
MMTENFRDRGFDFFLNCALLFLPLPAMKMSAKVLHYQGYSLSLFWLVSF